MEFLKTLKAGDTVIIDGQGHSRDQRVATVEKVTSTQITAGGERFTRASGAAIGYSGRYTKPHLREPTPAMLDLIRRRVVTAKLARALSESQVADQYLLPIEVLEAMAAPLTMHKAGL